MLQGANRNFTYEDNWKYPECPEGWAIVKVAFSGICGSDLPRFGEQGAYHYPVILGHEFSGEVVKSTGKTGIREGDKVAVLPLMPCMQCEACKDQQYFHCKSYQFIGSRNDGGFGEFCAVKEENLFKLPPDMDIKEASLIEPALVGLHVVRRSGFRAGMRAIVFGAGPIGLMVASWLRVLGAGEIVISDVRDYSLNIAGELGFTKVFNPKAQDVEDIGTFDVSFEAAGAGAALQNAIRVTRNNGSVTVVGRDIGDTVIPVKLFEMMMRKEISLLGCWGYKMEGEEELVYNTFKNGTLRLNRFITHIVSPGDTVETVRKMLDKQIEYCKVLIQF